VPIRCRRYRTCAGATEARPRRVAPLGLVLKGGIWYLIAQHENSIRTYRAANIHDAEVCGELFVRPKGFDLALHWAKAAREYEAGVYHAQADVRLSPKGMLLLELLGPHVTEAASRTAGKPDRKGWLRCTLPLESFDFGVRELMRLGDEVEVIAPAALRAQLVATAKRIAKIHATRCAKRAAKGLPTD
jgi:predicted DNA-binding transcriptional regulator YafY